MTWSLPAHLLPSSLSLAHSAPPHTGLLFVPWRSSSLPPLIYKPLLPPGSPPMAPVIKLCIVHTKTNFMGLLMEMTYYITTYEHSCQNCLNWIYPEETIKFRKRDILQDHFSILIKKISNMRWLVIILCIIQKSRRTRQTSKTGISNKSYAVTSS